MSQATGCCCLFLFSELLPTIVGTSFPIRPHNTIGAQLRIVNLVSPHCKLYFFSPFFDLPSSRVIKVNAYTALDITLLLLNNISMFHSIYRYRGRGGGGRELRAANLIPRLSCMSSTATQQQHQCSAHLSSSSAQHSTVLNKDRKTLANLLPRCQKHPERWRRERPFWTGGC